jgi:succinylarginine dihydrolase
MLKQNMSTMLSSPLRECQLDGLVGPTHNYGGLSHGNVASTRSGGDTSNPRAAALEGLAKMRFVRSLGVPQAVLPPHERPSLPFLRQLGFRGADEAVLAAAAAEHGALYLRLASSASSMWTANAATVVPSRDAEDGRVHLAVANLARMAHRAIEPAMTARILGAVFGDARHFVVHDALPSAFADEGAANHTRLETSRGAVHLFAWGRRATDGGDGTARFPARQTIEASAALARLHRLPRAMCRFPRQHPVGIDAGAFHTDVLAVGSGDFLMMHELAFDDDALLADLRETLGQELVIVRATEEELPLAHAIQAYPFNSQILPLPDGTMAILAPRDAEEDEPSRRFLERVVASRGPVRAVHYIDVRQSMRNGGGPACLRLRVPLEPAERSAIVARVFLDDALEADLARWIERRYRDRLSPDDLADPSLHRESMEALDELTRILHLGSIYDFQRARSA